MMLSEVNSLRGVGITGQKQSLLEEVQSTLETVVLCNSIKENRHGNGHLFQSWRQLVEVTLHTLVQGGGRGGGGGGVMKKGEVSVLFELTQELLTKVEGCVGSVLSGEVFRVLLILMSHLSHTATTAVAEDNDSLLTTLFSAPLQAIMRSMVGTIQSTPGSMQLARAHLYGSLLYYLTVARQHPSGSNKRRGQNIWQLEWNENSLTASNLATITSFGEPLMEVVCRDASSGHDVTRMLSLSLLDAIFSIDHQGSWLKFLVTRGYLAKLCASLLWEDEGLQKMLHPQPEALKALYIHESKMALLTRLAQTPAGSRELLAANCIGYLTQCHFIDLRPDYHGNQPGGLLDPIVAGFVPSVSDRYRQLLSPLLKLLLTVLTCPGAQRSEVKAQVTSLIGAHTDTFTAILKSHRGSVSMATLEELSLVTGVIGHSGVGQDWSDQDSTAVGSGMMYIQRLMMSLIPHYCDRRVWPGVVSDAVRRDGGEGREGGEGGGSSDPLLSLEAQLKIQQICANIINYCRTAMTMGGTEYSSPYCRILFSPDLMASLAAGQAKDGPHTFHTSSSSHLTPSQAQSLGHLIRHLREVCEGYTAALDSCQQLERKLNSTSSLTHDEILQLVSLSGSSLPLPHQQALACRKLKKLLSATHQQMQLYTYIAENLLYVLWRHLQFYLVHCKPVGGARELGVGGVSFAKPTMRRLGEQAKVTAMETTFDLSSLSDGVSTADIEQVKGSVGRCLPSSLFKQLLDMEETQLQTKRSKAHVGFIQALVHRIRKLVKLRAATAPPITL